jgi:hypothetical protein
LRASDRALLVWMTRIWPSLIGLTRVVQPATILRWQLRARSLSARPSDFFYQIAFTSGTNNP